MQIKIDGLGSNSADNAYIELKKTEDNQIELGAGYRGSQQRAFVIWIDCEEAADIARALNAIAESRPPPITGSLAV